METAYRNNPAVVALEEAVGMPVGSTIRNIGAEHRIATARPQTGLAALREATPWPTVRLVLDNSLAARAATCPAIALVEEVVVVASATGPAAESAGVIERGLEERIALAAGISRVAVAETGMPSEEVPGVPGATTDRAPAPAAAAAPPAWDPEAEAPVAVAVVAVGDGADKKPTGAPA